MFRLYDQENSGRLHLVELAAALRESDVGLSQLQLQAVLSEANADDEDGTVNYRDFSVAAAGLISSSEPGATANALPLRNPATSPFCPQ